MASGRARSGSHEEPGSPAEGRQAGGGQRQAGEDPPAADEPRPGAPLNQQRLRWDSRALLRLAEAVDRLDISKHWNYGSKTKFWYKVLRELAADETRDTHLQPHINTLNQKFGEMYDAYEAGHLGLQLPPSSKGRLSPNDLPPELKAILAKIYEKFKHVR